MRLSPDPRATRAGRLRQTSSNTDLVMHACPQSTADTFPISGRGSTYPAQTAKHIPELWVRLHVSSLSVYNCISTNAIELVNL